jgi:hypothetical protein
MTNTQAAECGTAPAQSLSPAALAARAHPLGLPTLGFALLLGIAGDALVTQPLGPGIALWAMLVALTATALVWRAGREVPAAARIWLVVAVACATAITWTGSHLVEGLDVLGMLGAFMLAAIAFDDAGAALADGRFRDLLRRVRGLAFNALFGVIPLTLRELLARPSQASLSPTRRSAVRRGVLVLSILLLFGSLLRGADPIFASLVAVPALDLGNIASHVVVIGVWAWFTAGWVRGGLIDTDPHADAAPLRFLLDRRDLTATLGTLIALFSAFVLVQLGWFFGGEPFLQRTTNLTAAEYARQGFFSLVMVVMLVIPVLVVTRVALRPGRSVVRRHTMLALPVVGLVAAMLISAVARMRLYVHYYGLTEDRFDTLLFMGWLAVVLGWFTWTMLRRRESRFLAGVVTTGFVALALFNVMAPDRIIARVNLARAADATTAERTKLDLAHLAQLGPDATDLAVRAVLDGPRMVRESGSGLSSAEKPNLDRCNAATALLNAWIDPSRRHASSPDVATWRSWRPADHRVTLLVQAHESELRIAARGCRVLHPHPTPAAATPASSPPAPL